MNSHTAYTLKLERVLLDDRNVQDLNDFIRLVACDGERFRVPKYLVLISNLISFKVLYQPNEPCYYLPNVTGRILSRVLEFCHFHTKKRPVNSEKKVAAFIEIEKPMTQGSSLRRYTEKFDAKFIQEMPHEDVLHLYYAGHYLDIKPLVELVMAHLATRFFKASHVTATMGRSARFRDDFGLGTMVDNKILQEKGMSRKKKRSQDHSSQGGKRVTKWQKRKRKK